MPGARGRRVSTARVPRRAGCARGWDCPGRRHPAQVSARAALGSSLGVCAPSLGADGHLDAERTLGPRRGPPSPIVGITRP